MSGSLLTSSTTKARKTQDYPSIPGHITEEERQTLERAASILGVQRPQLPSRLADFLGEIDNGQVSTSSETIVDATSGAATSTDLLGGNLDSGNESLDQLLGSAGSHYDFGLGGDFELQNHDAFLFDNGISISDTCFRLFEPNLDEFQSGTEVRTQPNVEHRPNISASDGVSTGFRDWDINVPNSTTTAANQVDAQQVSEYDLHQLGSIQDLQFPVLSDSDLIDFFSLDTVFPTGNPILPVAERACGSDESRRSTASDNVVSSPRSRDSNSADATAREISKQPGRRGPFKNPDERLQTGITRKLGACVRCRMQKIRV